jgi:hypothetical protein
MARSIEGPESCAGCGRQGMIAWDADTLKPRGPFLCRTCRDKSYRILVTHGAGTSTLEG